MGRLPARSQEPKPFSRQRRRATLRLDATGDGTPAGIAWSLWMRSMPLQVAARVAYPPMRWGHDRVVDIGMVAPELEVHSALAGGVAQSSCMRRRWRFDSAVLEERAGRVLRYGWKRRSRRLLVTTNTELKAIATAAINGLRNPAAASGMAAAL
jgi:hypothetical protein